MSKLNLHIIIYNIIHNSHIEVCSILLYATYICKSVCIFDLHVIMTTTNEQLIIIAYCVAVAIASFQIQSCSKQIELSRVNEILETKNSNDNEEDKYTKLCFI